MSGLSGLTNNPEAELWFIISLLGLKPKTNLLWRYLILARALTEVTAISIHPISKTLNIVYGSEFWQIFLGELTSSTSSMQKLYQKFLQPLTQSQPLILIHCPHLAFRGVCSPDLSGAGVEFDCDNYLTGGEVNNQSQSLGEPNNRTIYFFALCRLQRNFLGSSA